MPFPVLKGFKESQVDGVGDACHFLLMQGWFRVRVTKQGREISCG